MARVVVLGAAGMLGREVCAALVARGHAVTPAGRAARRGWIRFDAERDDPATLVAGDPDLVVNCAAVLASEAEADPTRASAVNASFPHRLAACDVRLVHISTDAVFRDDAGSCTEEDPPDASDIYGRTKREGEPAAPNAISLRCSFVGLDPERRRGVVEWLLSQPPGATVRGYSDQAWNGLAAGQVARACAALADSDAFDAARGEGPVVHLFEDPPTTKHGLLVAIATAFELPLEVRATDSGRPVTRVLASHRRALHERLLSGPDRAASLAHLAQRRRTADA